MDYDDLDIQAYPTAEKLPPASADLTAIYLREVGAVPLLDRQDEVDLASELQQARKDFAQAVSKLPAAFRRQVNGAASDKPRTKPLWSLRQIEAAYDRLKAQSRESPALGRNSAYRSVLDAKRRLDRSRDAMIEANLRLVAHVAKKFCNQGMPYMDLVQEGNLGLMKAVEKFEHERGYKFSTYAFWWIKQAITRAIADKSRTIRIPVHLLERIRKVRRAARELEETLGREPSAKEIATRIHVSVKAVVDLLGPEQDDDGS